MEQLFELDSPHALFRETQIAFAEYHKEPNSRLLLFLLFALNHLREWIAGKGYQELLKAKKKGHELSEAEEFCLSFDELDEFQIVRALCNRSKHHKITTNNKTSVTIGLTCNGYCSDSLGQKYYRIDGIDSRQLFFPLIRKYYLWFENKPGDTN